MTAVPSKDHIYTFDEYLEIEQELEGRYEFHDGRMYLMSGTYKHSEIIENISGRLFVRLGQKKRRCRVSSGQLKLWIS